MKYCTRHYDTEDKNILSFNAIFLVPWTICFKMHIFKTRHGIFLLISVLFTTLFLCFGTPKKKLLLVL